MKSLKVFGILTVLMMTVGLSSCVKTDDGDDLNKKWQEWVEQVDTEIKASVGTYEGKLYSQSNESTEEDIQLDEIDATWRINADSTLDLLNVPVELLVKKMPESQKALHDAVCTKGNVEIHVKMVYNYYYHSPLVMYVYPQYVTFPVEYEGASHQVKIYIRSTETATNSLAQYMMKNDTGYVHECMVQLYPESLYMDDKLQTQFSAEAYLIWLGAKKEVQ